MIHEFTLVLDREPTDAELETLAASGLDPIGTEGPHPALAHLRHRRSRAASNSPARRGCQCRRPLASGR